MSRLADIEARMRSFQDIGDILSAMKNLSLVEITKLSRFCQAQEEIIQTIHSALVDFQQFYENIPLPEDKGEGSLCILIGSERGFCGGFNEVIRQTLSSEEMNGTCSRLILVGRRLALRFPENHHVVAAIEGAGTTEDIPAVIARLVDELARHPTSTWRLIYNRYDDNGAHTEVTSFSEFSDFARPGSSPAHAYAPLLNLPAAELRPQLVERYLFALFYGALYLSFMAENHARLRHMEGALDKIRGEQGRMQRLSEVLRQENITEELELILLNVREPPHA